jgi:RNA polymerase sigma-70 factor, ECF subfamily
MPVVEKMAGGPYFEDAFPRLFVEAYWVANKILSNHSEAEDVAAEAAARALQRWRRVRNMESPSGWVMRVASNLAVDMMRRRRFVAQDSRETHALSGNGAPTAGTSDAGMVDDQLFVRGMLHQLPSRQRQVVALRYLVDLSESETASVLGISTGSVKRHASRALERLRRGHEDEVTSYV